MPLPPPLPPRRPSGSTPPPLPPPPAFGSATYGRPQPAPASRLPLIIGIAIALVVLVGGVAVWRVIDGRRLPPMVVENTDEKHKETQDAFDSASIPLSDAEETSRIKQCIDLFTINGAKKSSTNIVDAFDYDRFEQELDRQNAFDGISSRDRGQFKNGMKQGIRQSLTQVSAQMATRDIKRVKFSDNRREALVYTRDEGEDGTRQKTRWWLRRTGTNWRVFDLESLDGGLRVSTLITAGIHMAGNSGSNIASFQTLVAAIRSIQAGDAPKAQTELESVKNVSFPPELESVRNIAWAAIHANQQELDLVLADCDAIAATGQDAPLIHQFRATAYNKLEQYDKALASCQEWKAALGGDVEVYYETGLALAGLGRQAEAVTAFGQALDDAPDAVSALEELAGQLPADRKKEIGQRFARCTKPKLVFADVAPELQKKRELVALESMINAYRAMGTDDVWIDYYTAELCIIRKQWAQAEAIFVPVLKKAPSVNSVELFERQYLNAAMTAGHEVEAYKNVSDKRRGFRQVADWLNTDPPLTARIAKLVAVHQPGNENDPTLLYYQGLLHSAAGEYDAAEKSYQGAAATGLKDDQPRILSGLVISRFKAGKPLADFADLKPRRSVLLQLAKLYVTARKADDLEKLALVWENEMPKDKVAALYKAEAKYLRADYAGVISVLEPNKTSILSDTSLRNRFRNLYVRSLAAVKRYDDALTCANDGEFDEAGEVDAKSHHFYSALIHAAAGRVDDATSMIQTCLTEGYTLGDFYTDWVSGPALRSDKFAQWRKTNPQPAPATRPS